MSGKFGAAPAVYELVMEVTIRTVDGVKEPKREYLLRLMRQGSSRARTLKLADRISNLFALGFVHDIEFVDMRQIVEETLPALRKEVEKGKVRYVGASAGPAWEFARALYHADRGLWARFVSMQNHYNLVYREEEREMLPLCRDEGIGVIPWSPLARGRLEQVQQDREQPALQSLDAGSWTTRERDGPRVERGAREGAGADGRSHGDARRLRFRIPA